MAQNAEISLYRAMVLEHSRRRRSLEAQHREERAELIAEQKRAYEALKARQERDLYLLRSRCIIEEKEFKVNRDAVTFRQVCKRSYACTAEGKENTKTIDPVALEPIPPNRQREEVGFKLFVYVCVCVLICCL